MSKEQFGSLIDGSKMIAERIGRQKAKVEPHFVIVVEPDEPVLYAGGRASERRDQFEPLRGGGSLEGGSKCG
jgi:hypothetical protein